MKTVFSTKSQVAHAWGQQNQLFGRSPTPSNPNGYGWASGDASADYARVRFLGRVFYSYLTPVARLEDTPEGFALLTVPNEWGPSTGSHISEASGAVRHLVNAMPGATGRPRVFEVPHIGGAQGPNSQIDRVDAGNAAEWAQPEAIDHFGNLRALRATYRAEANAYRAKRGNLAGGYCPGFEWGAATESDVVRYWLRHAWERADDYARLFGPISGLCTPWPADLAAVEAEAVEIISEREARAARALARLTPKEIARREAAKVERAARAAEARALRYAGAAEKLEGWQRGLNFSYGVPRADSTGAAYIRATGVKRDKSGAIKSGTLETSQGARVPLIAAVRLFQFIKCQREAGKGWEPSGLRTIRVGDFTVNRIEASGDFVAGCHKFAWPEIERLAKSLGVFALPCDRAAESA